MEHFHQSIPSLPSQTLQEGGGFHGDEWIRVAEIISTSFSEQNRNFFLFLLGLARHTTAIRYFMTVYQLHGLRNVS
jgi:hypothetical protein